MRNRAAITSENIPPLALLGLGLGAGIAGGLAEILWISVYSAGVGGGAVSVARGVAAAVGLGGAPGAATLGVVLHMALAALLGVAVIATLVSLPVRWRNWQSEVSVALIALAAVWAVNFLVILPVLSPEFVNIVPMPVSFASKLLFGLASFAAFRAGRAAIPEILPAPQRARNHHRK